MKILIQTFFRSKYNTIAARVDHYYQRVLRAYGLEDCPELQVTAAVVVSVAVWYLCAGLQAIADAISATSHTLTALVTG